MKGSMTWTYVVHLLGLTACALGVPQKQAYRVKETVDPPTGWVQYSPAPADHIIDLRIGLPQDKFELLEQALYEVSDPHHHRYGQHLSKEEVDELVAPHPKSMNAVDEWLASHGIDMNSLSRSSAKDWVMVKVPVNLAEKMLDTTYHVWKHVESGVSLVRTTTYSLPEHVHDHVDLVTPTTYFGPLKGMSTTFHWSDAQPAALSSNAPPIKSASGTAVDASCNSTITISCLQQLYNITGYNSSAINGNKIGITGYLEQYANIQDLQSFYQEQRPDALGSSFNYTSVNGGQNSQNLSEAGAEANLDVQFAFGLTHPTPAYFYSTGGQPPYDPDLKTTTDTNEPYAEWLDYILSHPNPPQTISTSYGDDEQTVPQSYAVRTCAGFAQLGARGVSLLVSSGDGGVGDNDANATTTICKTNDGRNATRFIPTYPATCPYVTSVGGTVSIPEVAVYFSGGGFSNYFPTPLYQLGAVTEYLGHLPLNSYSGLFNRFGRGFPDVSAQGDYFRVWIGGKPAHIGGTSASSPAFAGVVSLLNDARLSKGLPPLGFLNPMLYTKGVKGLTDITEGNNPGCGTEGFNATTGWDPITGLGTPNFGLLKEIVLS
ncbi:tripeptidyl peptidase A [Heliocybe sulcata]|uniref:tripeptidyl-peptidase II n=1 Tax=Heliocybe sulcata TaxID=5364 RepID=A0A5C3MXB6_9AGAM|nr:tripeptidyl peptidase A [Heliocybe sulcata]